MTASATTTHMRPCDRKCPFILLVQRPALGDAQTHAVEQGDNFLEFDVPVAAVDMIEKAFPVPRGPSKVNGQYAAAGL